MSRHKIVGHYGVRNERYKLIYYYGEALGASGTEDISIPPEWELFDLEKDPTEMSNVYSDPGYVDVVREMTAELDRLQVAAGDEGLH